MLDHSHPMTPHVFHAARLMDGVLVRGQRMTVSPSDIRRALLAECLPLLNEIRELARQQFGNRIEFIQAAVDEYEVALHNLAGLGKGQIQEDQRDGEGECSVCGTPITKFRPLPFKEFENHWIIVCGGCDVQFMEAHQKLDSSDGFGTFAI